MILAVEPRSEYNDSGDFVDKTLVVASLGLFYTLHEGTVGDYGGIAFVHHVNGHIGHDLTEVTDKPTDILHAF